MAVYFVTGKLGAGKSLAAVGRMRDYLRQGRRVATNLDLYLEHMFLGQSRATALRLPDKPRALDLVGLGRAYEGKYDETKTGLLVLDECGTWLNSRNWQDKERVALLDWCLHARKYGWDVMFLVQDVESVDKQLRKALCEHLVICRRLDRLAVPFVGALVKLATFGLVKLRLPKMHVATVYYGDSAQGLRVDRWWYQASELYEAYDTEQVFVSGEEFVGGSLVDMRAPYSMLSAWHLRGRYLDQWTVGRAVRLVAGLYLLACLRLVARLRGVSPRQVAAEWGVLR